MKLVVRVRESSVWVAWPFSVAGALAECSHQGGLGRGELCPTTRGGGRNQTLQVPISLRQKGGRMLPPRNDGQESFGVECNLMLVAAILVMWQCEVILINPFLSSS